MMQRGPGLAASPPVRNNLEVGGEKYSSYVFPRWADNRRQFGPDKPESAERILPDIPKLRVAGNA